MKLSEYLQLTKTKPAAFARKIKVSKMAVSRYLNGRIPEPRIIKRIIRATKGEVSADDFFIRRPARPA